MRYTPFVSNYNCTLGLSNGLYFCTSGKSVAQVSLRWLLQKDVVPSVVIGAKNMAQLEDNLGAASGWELTQEQVSYKILYKY